MGQVFSSTMVLDTYADIARSFVFEDRRTGGLGQPVTVRRVPVGVAAGIIPWNVPLFIMAMKLGPAMAAGVPVVLKPAPETPLDAYLLAEAVIEAGLPPGVVNIVAARTEASEYLVRHPGVDKVAFTGSTNVGRTDRRDLRRADQARVARARRQVGRDPARGRRPRRRRSASSSAPAS